MTEETELEASISPIYWELDEKHNALDYLEMGMRCLMEVEWNPWAWKWVCIALHGALYGFAVCAVRGTSNIGLTYETKDGHPRLKNFDAILRMCQDDECMRQYDYSKTLTLDEDQKEAINFLKNELRNSIEHFVPMTWLIEIHGLPKMVSSYFEIIEFLALDSGNVWLEEHEKVHVKALCTSGRSLALSTKTHWEIAERQ